MSNQIELKTFKGIYPSFSEFESKVVANVKSLGNKTNGGANTLPDYLNDTKTYYTMEMLYIFLSNKYDEFIAVNTEERQSKLMVNAFMHLLPALYIKTKTLTPEALTLLTDPVKLLSTIEKRYNEDADTKYASTETSYSSTPDDSQDAGNFDVENIKEKNVINRKDASVRIREMTNLIGKLKEMGELNLSGFVDDFINSIEISSLWQAFDENAAYVIRGVDGRDGRDGRDGVDGGIGVATKQIVVGFAPDGSPITQDLQDLPDKTDPAFQILRHSIARYFEVSELRSQMPEKADKQLVEALRDDINNILNNLLSLKMWAGQFNLPLNAEDNTIALPQEIKDTIANIPAGKQVIIKIQDINGNSVFLDESFNDTSLTWNEFFGDSVQVGITANEITINNLIASKRGAYTLTAIDVSTLLGNIDITSKADLDLLNTNLGAAAKVGELLVVGANKAVSRLPMGVNGQIPYIKTNKELGWRDLPTQNIAFGDTLAEAQTNLGATPTEGDILFVKIASAIGYNIYQYVNGAFLPKGKLEQLIFFNVQQQINVPLAIGIWDATNDANLPNPSTITIPRGDVITRNDIDVYVNTPIKGSDLFIQDPQNPNEILGKTREFIFSGYIGWINNLEDGHTNIDIRIDSQRWVEDINGRFSNPNQQTPNNQTRYSVPVIAVIRSNQELKLLASEVDIDFNPSNLNQFVKIRLKKDFRISDPSAPTKTYSKDYVLVIDRLTDSKVSAVQVNQEYERKFNEIETRLQKLEITRKDITSTYASRVWVPADEGKKVYITLGSGGVISALLQKTPTSYGISTIQIDLNNNLSVLIYLRWDSNATNKNVIMAYRAGNEIGIEQTITKFEIEEL